MNDSHEGWHEISIATPLPMTIASAVMQLIGTAWPEAIIRPTQKKRWGAEPVFTMLVPPRDPLPLSDDEAAEIRQGAEDAEFTGFRVDEDARAWVSTAPPEGLTLFLGEVAHNVFTKTEGVVNYLEWEVKTKDGSGRYILSVAATKERTPHSLRMKAESERDELRTAIKLIRDAWDGGDLAAAVNEAVALLPEETDEQADTD